VCRLIYELALNIPVVPRSKHFPVFVMKTRLTLYWELIAVCSEVGIKHIKTFCGQNFEFLVAFAKLRKATFSFVMSVCLSFRPFLRMEQLGSHWKDFY